MIIKVHHSYRYDLFWYLFHSVSLKEKLPHFTEENRLVKNKRITEKVIIHARYDKKDFEIHFVGEDEWDDEEAVHILDITFNAIENGAAYDRMYIEQTIHSFLDNRLPLLNSLDDTVKKNTHVFSIFWEGFTFDKNDINLIEKIDKKINTYSDTITLKDNFRFIFTQSFYSLIYPEENGVKNYYHFYEWLKYKNDYKHKILYPVRRIYDSKLYVAKAIDKLNNPNFLISYSSFNESNYIPWLKSEYNNVIDEFLEIPNKVKIDKGGHTLDDWGGEWMENNMNENMWRIYSLSEVILIHENPMNDCFSEKTISCILSGKPFLDVHYRTIKRIHKILELHNISIPEYPLPEYDDITNVFDILDNVTKDEEKWIEFKSKLIVWQEYIRNNFLKIITTKNSFLDIIKYKDKSLL